MKRTYFFIHQHMPAQFPYLCRHLGERGDTVIFITRNEVSAIARTSKLIYRPERAPRPETHPYLATLEDGVLHGQAVYKAIIHLLKLGYRPDLIVGHAGWGETMFVKDILPNTPLLDYWEFFYNALGQDAGFDSEYPGSLDSLLSLRVKNAISLLSSVSADWGLTPTHWQASTHPAGMRAKMSVIHEGVDTLDCRPDKNATFRLPNGRLLRGGGKVITYAARNLEPYRGFHVFMRALGAIQQRHPDAEIVIIGNDGVSYGARLPEGQTYKSRLIREVAFNPDTVHFTGTLPWSDLRSLLQISSAHVYLTYPFVLSWSMLQAMACGCLVIGSNTAPVAEVIENRRNGLLVDFFDRAALVDLVDEALQQPGDFSRIREEARRTIVASYDLQSICLPRQLELFEQLVSGEPPLPTATRL